MSSTIAELQPGEVAAGPRQTLYEALFYHFIPDRNDNGDGCRRLLGSPRWSVRMQPDHIWRELDQLGREGWEPVRVLLGIAVDKGDVVPLHIAKVAQALLEGRESMECEAVGTLAPARRSAGFFPEAGRRR